MVELRARSADESFTRAMSRARGYLAVPEQPRRAWPVLLAATFFAISSMVFATAAIMAPSVTLTHLPPSETLASTLH
ncbi:MAG: hypothetical protein P4L64_05200 [Caulobacteraceae bacterium]|nr:hypothetical protein [Caulobacteraceae bacterium]